MIRRQRALDERVPRKSDDPYPVGTEFLDKRLQFKFCFVLICVRERNGGEHTFEMGAKITP